MRKKKIRLGKQIEGSYKYSTSLNLGKDLFSQVEDFLKEERIREALSEKVKTLQVIIDNFKGKGKKGNLSYYYTLGKKLQFIEEPPFSKVEQYSLFRVIYELCPEILSHILNPKVAAKHIAAMFYLGKIELRDLDRATWSQWYELTKFKDLFENKNSYRGMLLAIRGKRISGPKLRLLINKELRKT